MSDRKTCQVSVDNGVHYYDAEDLADIDNGYWFSSGWNVLVNSMDDETCAAVHNELAPCTNLDFLARYLELAPYDLVVG